MVLVKAGTYPITASIVGAARGYLKAESWKTILQATSNSQTIIADSTSTQLTIEGFTLDTGGKTGVVGIDLSRAEASTIQRVRDIHTTGAFSTVVNMDGNEDSMLDWVFTEGAGDIYAHVQGGAVYLDHVIMNNVGEGVLHANGQLVDIDHSVLNSIQIDQQTQTGSASTPFTGITMRVQNTYLANPTNSAGQHKIRSADGASTDNSGIRSLQLENCYLGTKNNNAFFANSHTGAVSFAIVRLSAKNCFFQNIDASTVNWVKNASGSTVNIGGGSSNFADGSDMLVWDSNETTGTIGAGDNVNNGLASFPFAPRPAGFNTTTPSVPATTINQKNNYPYPIEITITGAGTVTDYTITDFQGNTAVTTAALFIGEKMTLGVQAQIKFTFTGAPTWKWKGL